MAAPRGSQERKETIKINVSKLNIQKGWIRIPLDRTKSLCLQSRALSCWAFNPVHLPRPLLGLTRSGLRGKESPFPIWKSTRYYGYVHWFKKEVVPIWVGEDAKGSQGVGEHISGHTLQCPFCLPRAEVCQLEKNSLAGELTPFWESTFGCAVLWLLKGTKWVSDLLQVPELNKEPAGSWSSCLGVPSPYPQEEPQGNEGETNRKNAEATIWL